MERRATVATENSSPKESRISVSMARGEEPRKNDEEASRGWEDDRGVWPKKGMDGPSRWRLVSSKSTCKTGGVGTGKREDDGSIRYDMLAKSNGGNIPC